MYLKAIFLPWLVIREMGRDIARLDAELDGVERDLGRCHRTAVRQRLRIVELDHALADLKSRALFRDPRTGRMAKADA